METLQVVHTYLQALSARNLSLILSLFGEETDWYIPGDSEKAPWLGRRRTKSEIRAFFQLLWDNTIPMGANIDHIFVDGKRAVIAGDFRTGMLATDQICESLFFIHLTAENGLITRYRLLEDSLAVYQSLLTSSEQLRATDKYLEPPVSA